MSRRASSTCKLKSARRVSRPEARRQAALAINASLNPDDTLAAIVRQACALTTCRRSAVYLLDGEVGTLHLVAGHRLPDGLLGSKLSASRSVVGQAFRGQRVLVTDAADPLAADPCLGPKLAAVPLVTHRKRLGVLQVARGAKERRFSSGDIAELEWFAPLAAQALANARLFRLAEIQGQQVRAVLSSTDNVVLCVDAETRLMAANAVAERAFGFRVEVCAGQPLSEIAQNQALHQAMDQAYYQHDARWRTFRVPLSQERILSCTMSPILTRGGILQGWVLVMQDITQFKEMEQLRTDMILTASHELRNPINLTSGALDLLDQHLEAPSTLQREALDLAKLGIERAGALIGDLLDLERIERRVGMRPGRCDCALLLGSLGSEFRLWAQNHDKALQMRVPDMPLLVWGDEHLLQRVVSNLVDNALKYTPPGGCITVDACAQAGQVILRVSDTGPGISLEAQSHVFERFYRQSDQPDSVEGTGLGLTIVKSIVEQHGGRVWVTSRPGQGSTFTVSLPALDT